MDLRTSVRLASRGLRHADGGFVPGGNQSRRFNRQSHHTLTRFSNAAGRDGRGAGRQRAVSCRPRRSPPDNGWCRRDLQRQEWRQHRGRSRRVEVGRDCARGRVDAGYRGRCEHDRGGERLRQYDRFHRRRGRRRGIQLEKVDGDGQAAPPGAALGAHPRVRVADAYGNSVAGVTATFVVEDGGG